MTKSKKQTPLSHTYEHEHFEVIFKENYKNMYVFIKKYTADNGLAEDIVQETFMKLWNIRDSINPELSVKSLLYTTAYNLFIDKKRKEKNRRKAFDDLLYKKQLELLEEDNEDLDKKIEIIIKTIEELPPRCREIFIMSKQEGYKYWEIAEILNISSKTVEVQISKAFSIIRERVKDEKTLQLFLNFFRV